MKPYLFRPYSGRHLPEASWVFNYRLSRARRIVENAFGILTQRWRVYTGRLQVGPETADSVVRATCILHNYIQSTSKTVGQNEPDDDEDEDEDGERILRPLRNLRRNRASEESQTTRDTFRQHFTSSAEQVPWQYAHVRRGCRV